MKMNIPKCCVRIVGRNHFVYENPDYGSKKIAVVYCGCYFFASAKIHKWVYSEQFGGWIRPDCYEVIYGKL